MMIPKNLKYSKEHEWVKEENGIVRVGITDYAQEALGDVVFVELPEVGDSFAAGEAFGSVESVKAVSDCYMPVSGTVKTVNEALLESPELVNEDPYGKGWMIEIEPDNKEELEELMSAAEYEEYLATLEEGDE
ncbi:MAG: glycine cleavage system protein GcvH [Peptococcaceae bacterium]|nr:glycine cleavage system protein GcvH [Peptococcaceae bacterium]